MGIKVGLDPNGWDQNLADDATREGLRQAIRGVCRIIAAVNALNERIVSAV